MVTRNSTCPLKLGDTSNIKEVHLKPFEIISSVPLSDVMLSKSYWSDSAPKYGVYEDVFGYSYTIRRDFVDTVYNQLCRTEYIRSGNLKYIVLSIVRSDDQITLVEFLIHPNI